MGFRKTARLAIFNFTWYNAFCILIFKEIMRLTAMTQNIRTIKVALITVRNILIALNARFILIEKVSLNTATANNSGRTVHTWRNALLSSLILAIIITWNGYALI